MSGHSKWANIKNRKGAQDKKRSEAFTKVSKNILTAVRMGGGSTDCQVNNSLRVAIEKARGANMPKDNIDRLLKAFELRKANVAGYMFEGYGPAGVPVMIEVETDNKNRTLGEIKFIMKENDGSLGEEGSVAFQFKKVGEIELTEVPNDEQQLTLIDMGALDIDEQNVIVEAGSLHQMIKKMEDAGFKIESSEIVMKAINPLMLNSEEEVAKVLDMIDSLEENDDVVNVFAGFNYQES